MSLRFVLHISLCVLLAIAGWWLYQQLSVNSNYSVSSIQVASYWFGILIFILFSWIFYWILHRRSVKAWVIALIIAALIAVVSTAALLIISQDHEQQRQKALEQIQEPEMPGLDAIGPDAIDPGLLEQDGLDQETMELEQADETIDASP